MFDFFRPEPREVKKNGDSLEQGWILTEKPWITLIVSFWENQPSFCFESETNQLSSSFEEFPNAQGRTNYLEKAQARQWIIRIIKLETYSQKWPNQQEDRSIERQKDLIHV